MTNAMRIDFKNKKIMVTSAFAKKAEIFGTPEFRQFMEAKKELKEYTGEEFTVVIAKKAKKSVSIDEPKEKKIRPSYKMMYDFIISIDDEKHSHMEAFDEQRKMVRFGTTKYNATLDWFLKKYSKDDNYKDAFFVLKSEVVAKAPEEEPEENNTREFAIAVNN